MEPPRPDFRRYVFFESGERTLLVPNTDSPISHVVGNQRDFNYSRIVATLFMYVSYVSRWAIVWEGQWGALAHDVRHNHAAEYKGFQLICARLG